MQKKLTITIDESVYQGLHLIVGARKISKFIEKLVKPYVFEQSLYKAYEDMANDNEREQEAEEWVEGLAHHDFN